MANTALGEVSPYNTMCVSTNAASIVFCKLVQLFLVYLSKMAVKRNFGAEEKPVLPAFWYQSRYCVKT